MRTCLLQEALSQRSGGCSGLWGITPCRTLSSTTPWGTCWSPCARLGKAWASLPVSTWLDVSSPGTCYNWVSSSSASSSPFGLLLGANQRQGALPPEALYYQVDRQVWAADKWFPEKESYLGEIDFKHVVSDEDTDLRALHWQHQSRFRFLSFILLSCCSVQDFVWSRSSWRSWSSSMVSVRREFRSEPKKWKKSTNGCLRRPAGRCSASWSNPPPGTPQWTLWAPPTSEVRRGRFRLDICPSTVWRWSDEAWEWRHGFLLTGRWVTRFSNSGVMADFQVDGAAPVRIPMMQQDNYPVKMGADSDLSCTVSVFCSETVHLWDLSQTTFILLVHQIAQIQMQNDVSMFLFLPDEVTSNMTLLEDSLTAEFVQDLSMTLLPAQVSLTLPTLRLSYSTDLLPLLSDLGESRTRTRSSLTRLHSDIWNCYEVQFCQEPVTYLYFLCVSPPQQNSSYRKFHFSVEDRTVCKRFIQKTFTSFSLFFNFLDSFLRLSHVRHLITPPLAHSESPGVLTSDSDKDRNEKLWETLLSLGRLSSHVRRNSRGRFIQTLLFMTRQELSFVSIPLLGLTDWLNNPQLEKISGQATKLTSVNHKVVMETAPEGNQYPGATSTPNHLSYRVDRPFLYLIRDDASGALLFIGRVVNPKDLRI